MKITSIITMALGTTVSAQGFAYFCDHGSLSFKDGHILKLKCNTKHSSTKTTKLDLDECFTNDHGSLAPRDNGMYSKSCRKCQINPNKPTFLSCECKNTNGNYKGTQLDLNAYLSNQDGMLCCGKHCGEKALFSRNAGADDEYNRVFSKDGNDYVISMDDYSEAENETG